MSKVPTAHQHAAVRRAVSDNSADLLRYFQRRVAQREDAADLVGETLLQVWRRHDACPHGDTIDARMWVFSIAAHVLANHGRAARRRDALVQRLRDHLAIAPVTTPLESAEATDVRDAVLRLRDTHRELVMLVHWDGFTLVEAAKILGLNASTARSRYSAARDCLREAFKDAAVTGSRE